MGFSCLYSYNLFLKQVTLNFLFNYKYIFRAYNLLFNIYILGVGPTYNFTLNSYTRYFFLFDFSFHDFLFFLNINLLFFEDGNTFFFKKQTSFHTFFSSNFMPLNNSLNNVYYFQRKLKLKKLNELYNSLNFFNFKIFNLWHCFYKNILYVSLFFSNLDNSTMFTKFKLSKLRLKKYIYFFKFLNFFKYYTFNLYKLNKFFL